MKIFATNFYPPTGGQFVKILCIGLLVQGLAGCSEADKPFPEAGETFPLSVLKQITSIGGEKIDIKGKTLLINFWATWCVPCRNEMPDLQKLSDSLDPHRFAVIGVSVDEDSNLIREFILQYQIRFHNFQDDNYRLATELLGIKTYPQTFIVSPQGIITRRISEVLSWDQNMMEQFPDFGDKADTLTPLNRLDG